MVPLLALAVPLLLAAADGCYLVSNERIVVIPSCDFSPSAISALRRETRGPPSARDPSADLQRRSMVIPRGLRARPLFDVNRQRDLERRLDAAQQQRRFAEDQRLSAEQQRATALQQRDAALQELAAVRHALAAERARADENRVTTLEHGSGKTRARTASAER